MAKLRFEITTPERVVLQEEIDQVVIPTVMGEITILPDHIALIAELVPGEMRVKRGSEEELLAVAGGFVEVRPGNRVIILADAAEREEELDLQKIEEAEARARKILKEKQSADNESFAAASAVLEREMARLRVARKKRRTKRMPVPESG